LSMLVTSDPKKLPITAVTATLFMFSLWMVVTTIFALAPDSSFEMLSRVLKTMLMTFAAMMLIKTRQQITLLVWVLFGSIGYYGVKGGIFTIMSGGSSIVWGPEGSYIEGNNEVALAFITIIPIIYYLYLQPPESKYTKWIKRGLAASMVLCGVAALGSYSRGALLGIAGMLAFLWWKSPKKAAMGAVMVLLVPVAIAFMPDKWTSRMETINTYQEDSSAMGRINAWYMAYNLAKDRPLVGGGFDIWNGALFAIYAPDPDDPHAAHSIYFQALGEHGFVGLGLYLLLAFLTWKKGNWIIKVTAKRPEYAWAGTLATMLQVSLLGFGVGGAFLSLLYYDVPYYLMGLMVTVGSIVEQALKEESAALIAQKKADFAMRNAALQPGGGIAPSTRDSSSSKE